MTDKPTTIVPQRPSASIRPSLAALSEAFFARLTPNTRRGYEADLRRMAQWRGYKGADAVNRLTKDLLTLEPVEANAAVDAYVQELVQLGRAPATVNRALAAVRSLVKLGRKLGLVNWSLEATPVKHEARREVAGPNVEQVKRLFEANRDDARGLAVLTLLFVQGLRGVEVRELQWQHVRLTGAAPSLLVRRKGHRERQPVSIARVTVEALEAWAKKAPAGIEVNPGGPEPVFPGNQHHALTGAGLWKLVQRCGERAGIKLWPHALRHAAITAGLDATQGNLRAVQSFSGHGNVDMLRRYDDARRDAGRAVAEQLGSLVGVRRPR